MASSIDSELIKNWWNKKTNGLDKEQILYCKMVCLSVAFEVACREGESSFGVVVACCVLPY